MKEDYINERILSVKMKLMNGEIRLLIITYGKNEYVNKEEKDKYFTELHQ